MCSSNKFYSQYSYLVIKNLTNDKAQTTSYFPFVKTLLRQFAEVKQPVMTYLVGKEIQPQELYGAALTESIVWCQF